MFEELRKEIHEELSYYSTRELAIYFTRGFLGPEPGPDMTTEEVENKRMLIRDYLFTTPEKFQEEFGGHLDDPLLGEREGDT